MIILYILLAVIAYILWRIYRQREDEKIETYNEKVDLIHEQERKVKFKDYPHLYGKLEDNWLDVFAHHYESGLPLLKIAFLLMLGESTKIDYSEGLMKYDSLWDVSKELLEHLEKYHEGTIAEFEIAICTYWQIAAGAVGELIKQSPEKHLSDAGKEWAPIEGNKIEAKPFTNIEKITSLFPKKANHSEKEITFFKKDGSFPRESEGSTLVDEKIRALGL
jgi:flavodoxin